MYIVTAYAYTVYLVYIVTAYVCTVHTYLPHQTALPRYKQARTQPPQLGQQVPTKSSKTAQLIPPPPSWCFLIRTNDKESTGRSPCLSLLCRPPCAGGVLRPYGAVGASTRLWRSRCGRRRPICGRSERANGAETKCELAFPGRRRRRGCGAAGVCPVQQQLT